MARKHSSRARDKKICGLPAANGSGENLQTCSFRLMSHYRLKLLPFSRRFFASAAQNFPEFIHIKIDDGRCVEGQDLRDKQTANNGNSERLTQFRACPFLDC